jgi:hypothetical protein
VDKKVAEAEAKEKAKAAARAAGKVSGMSGKDLFDFSSDMLGDEDEVSGDPDGTACSPPPNWRLWNHLRTTKTSGICSDIWHHEKMKMTCGWTTMMRVILTMMTMGPKTVKAQRVPLDPVRRKE